MWKPRIEIRVLCVLQNIKKCTSRLINGLDLTEIQKTI